jgi:hypothetical protein
MEFRDGTTMYIIHSEVSLETFDQLNHLNENAVVINGIDGTITLEIDESILKRRLNEYFQRKVTTENQIKVTVADLVLKFRISEIKEIVLKSEAYFRLKFLLQEGEKEPFMRFLVECGGYLAMGTRPIVKISQKGYFLVMDRQALEEVKKRKTKADTSRRVTRSMSSSNPKLYKVYPRQFTDAEYANRFKPFRLEK